MQDCPVCGYTAFSPDHGDEYGMDIGVGQCLVCHYERTADVAPNESREAVFPSPLAEA
ncbi:hypothetical protein ACWGLP_20850 [Streptomyces lydicus]